MKGRITGYKLTLALERIDDCRYGVDLSFPVVSRHAERI
jgi:hypothetical protein